MAIILGLYAAFLAVATIGGLRDGIEEDRPGWLLILGVAEGVLLILAVAAFAGLSSFAVPRPVLCLLLVSGFWDARRQLMAMDDISVNFARWIAGLGILPFMPAFVLGWIAAN